MQMVPDPKDRSLNEQAAPAGLRSEVFCPAGRIGSDSISQLAL